MALPLTDYALYVVTDRSWLNGRSLGDRVEQAIQGGATLVQLREKFFSTRESLDSAVMVKRVTDSYGVPLLINDRLDIAMAVGAAGLHVGQSDMPVKTARNLLGKGKILGASVTKVQEALQAEREGADYLGVGAVFPTATKNDAAYVNFQELKLICSAVSIPVVAIGGINESNAMLLKGSGIAGIAVVSCIFAKQDVRLASETMKKLALELIRGAM